VAIREDPVTASRAWSRHFKKKKIVYFFWRLHRGHQGAITRDQGYSSLLKTPRGVPFNHRLLGLGQNHKPLKIIALFERIL